MRVATAVLLAALVAGCMPTSDALTDRPWRLVEIDGSAPASEAGITFGLDGRFAVTPGCNSGGGSYTIEGNRIATDAVRLTAMACGDAADSQEQAFLAILGATPRFEIETRTGRLRLTSGADALVFETP